MIYCKGCPELKKWITDCENEKITRFVVGNAASMFYYVEDGILRCKSLKPDSVYHTPFFEFKEQVLDNIWIKPLEVLDEIDLHGIKYQVVQGTKRYWLSNVNGSNDEIFEKLGLNSDKVTKEILGYYAGGSFPECKSLEDLTKLVNYLKNYKMSRKIYKPIDTQYLQAITSITGLGEVFLEEHGFEYNSFAYNSIVEAGVLHWFKEVEDVKRMEFNIPFLVVVKDGKAYHKDSEDITEFVKELVEYYHGTQRFGDPKRPATVREVEFESTGCERVTSKLSDWVKIYEEMNNQTL